MWPATTAFILYRRLTAQTDREDSTAGELVTESTITPREWKKQLSLLLLCLPWACSAQGDAAAQHCCRKRTLSLAGVLEGAALTKYVWICNNIYIYTKVSQHDTGMSGPCAGTLHVSGASETFWSEIQYRLFLRSVSNLIAEPAVSRDPYQALTVEGGSLLIILLRQENAQKPNGFFLQRVAKTLLRSSLIFFQVA